MTTSLNKCWHEKLRFNLFHSCSKKMLIKPNYLQNNLENLDKINLFCGHITHFCIAIIFSIY